MHRPCSGKHLPVVPEGGWCQQGQLLTEICSTSVRNNPADGSLFGGWMNSRTSYALAMLMQTVLGSTGLGLVSTVEYATVKNS